MDESGAEGLRQQYPRPPPYFKLYGSFPLPGESSASSDAGIGLPLRNRPDPSGCGPRTLSSTIHPPLPPRPELAKKWCAEDFYPLFGTPFEVPEGRPDAFAVPSLENQGVQQLVPEPGALLGPKELRRELHKMNREIVFQYMDLVGTLTESPGLYARKLEEVRTALMNMQYLLNTLRPAQSRAALLLAMDEQIGEQSKTILYVKDKIALADLARRESNVLPRDDSHQ